MSKLLVFLSISLLFSSKTFAQDEISVLFIGNSFTFMNNMPSIFKEIASSKGKKVYVDSVVQGGKNFEYHSNQLKTYEMIKSRVWDYIIIQGHSNELAQPDSKVETNSLPFARKIVDSIRASNSCTQVMLYMTWGYKNGNPKWAPIASYDSMQFRIKNQYLKFADLLDARVSPVGEVWKAVRTNYSGINLYDPDNQHPSLYGSYLSACTHFTSIFQESPMGNNSKVNVDQKVRQIIELNAAQIVLNNLNQWRNIEKNNILETGFDLILKDDTLELVNRSKNAIWMEWDFGDGKISVDENPSHKYLQKGNFMVSQKISNTCKTKILKREISIGD
jgi:hypothetical protein